MDEDDNLQMCALTHAWGLHLRAASRVLVRVLVHVPTHIASNQTVDCGDTQGKSHMQSRIQQLLL